MTEIKSYEPFPNRTVNAEARERLEWNESAREEYNTWLRLFQTVPRGVVLRKLQEEEHARFLEEEELNREEQERNAQGPDLDTWMPDEVCKVCYRCEEPFTLIRRRHHCRVCGLVFCGNCSSKSVHGLNYGFGNVMVRACDECYETRNMRSLKSPAVPQVSKKPTDRQKLRPEVVDDRTKNVTGPQAVRDDEAREGGSISQDVDTEEEEGVSGHEDDEEGLNVARVGVGEDSEPIGTSDLSPSQPETERSLIRRSSAPERPFLTHEDNIFASNFAFGIPIPKINSVLTLASREKSLMEALLDVSAMETIWRDTFARLCREAVDTVRPDPVLNGDALDICEYVRVQLIPWSDPAESFKVNGAVLRKNLIHRNMPRHFEFPRIMLLESDLELNRRGARLMAFETLLEQERLYLNLVVRKICSVKVNVLLVGGTVSSVAQELLLEKGVAVASLVSKRDLQWVSRLTGAAILPTTEYITRATDPTGTCDSWRCETIFIGGPSAEPHSVVPSPEDAGTIYPCHRSDPNHDTFMFFDGCLQEKGCTICLRGECWSSLRAKVPKFLDLLKRLWIIRLDHAFLQLMDGAEGLSRGGDSFYGDYRACSIDDQLNDTPNEDLLVLKSDRIEVGRVWLQETSQFSVPETTARAFYGARDRSFGEFLLRNCFDAKKRSSTGSSNNNMADGNYQLVFMHGFGRLRISAERLAKAYASDFHNLRVGQDVEERLRVLTWGVCKVCGEQANVKCLDKLVLGMSFAKWLQNEFYWEGVRSSRKSCNHSLFHDYTRFFFHGDFVVSVEFEPCSPLAFNLIDRIDLMDSSWYVLSAEQLIEEFSQTCEDVRQAFKGTTMEKAVERRLTELLKHGSEMRRVVAEEGDAESSSSEGSPCDVNRLFRDLFLACIDWNTMILSNEAAPETPRMSGPPKGLVAGLAVPSPRSLTGSLRSYNSADINNLSLLAGAGGRSNSGSRFRDLGPEPRLKRRPSLPEIRRAREIVLKKTFLGETSVLEDDYVQIPPYPPSLNTSAVASETSPNKSAGTTAASSDSLSSTTTALSTSKAHHPPLPRGLTISSSSTSSTGERKAVPLPVRLVEGHMLLPPGRRLGNIVTPVKESEPTSWIAHALASDEYSSKLMKILGSNASDMEKVLTSLSYIGGGDGNDDAPMQGIVLDDAVHINCGFSDASEYSPRQCAFSVRTFYAAQFHALRMLYTASSSSSNDEKNSSSKEAMEFAEKRFIESLSRCTTWKPTGGKSRATFLKTLDDRFILKSVSEEEFEMFQDLAPRYFAHLANVFGTKASPSMLVPFLGLFSVTMQSEVVSRRNLYHQQKPSSSSSGGGGNIYNKLLVVVSPNIFYKRSPQVMYDLKGNARGSRLVRNPESGSVRLDVNFFQDTCGVPLSLKPDGKEILMKAVCNDAAFLSSVGVVDYSLLVGVDEKNSVLTAGIIDYLQLYNYKKMFESTVKKAAGQAEPTVVSPRKYQARFVLAMDRYFISSGTPVLIPLHGNAGRGTVIGGGGGGIVPNPHSSMSLSQQSQHSQ